MASSKFTAVGSAAVGTDAYPASKILLRISIARATQHRCIDISLETVGVGANGQKRSWPVQMFNLSIKLDYNIDEATIGISNLKAPLH
ncbi:hypothetical protein CRYUN_Cryun09bG0137200 [Craigia yunnanensis]